MYICPLPLESPFHLPPPPPLYVITGPQCEFPESYSKSSLAVCSRMLVYVPGEGNGTPLQSSCLANPTDGGAWWAAIYGVARSRTRLSDFTFTFHFHALEKEMATHSSVLAWRIPGRGEPGGLPSLGSHRVGHDWSDFAVAAVYVPPCCFPFISSSPSSPPPCNI